MRANFRPPVWATLLLVCFTALCLWAGNWNLERAGERQALTDGFLEGEQTPVSAGPLETSEALRIRYRQIRLSGTFSSDRQILLDNMVSRGQAGYQVLTPLITAHGAVLVNRGWVPANPDRTILPDVNVSDDEREVIGRIDRLPVPGIRMGRADGEDFKSWPRRLQFPSISDVEKTLDMKVLGYQVLLNPDESDGFRREWAPSGIPPERNRGYALQWFSFAAAAAIIYVALNLRRKGDLAS